MDFLSTCPSLIHILQLTENEDILNCRTLNQQLAQAIHNNYCVLPRKKVERIVFKRYATDRKMESAMLCIYEGTASQTECYIYENKTRIRKLQINSSENDLVEEYVKDTGRPFKRHEAEDASVKVVYAFGNNGVENELHTIFSFIFRRYFLKRLDLDLNIPEKWIDLIIRAHSKKRSGCKSVSSPIVRPGLKSLSDALNTAIYYEENRENEDTFETDVMTMISIWDRPCLIRTGLEKMQLLTKWDSGELTLKYVELCGCSKSGVSFGWFNEPFENEFELLPDSVRLPTIDANNVGHKREIRIQRRSDRKSLSITATQDVPPEPIAGHFHFPRFTGKIILQEL